MPSLTLLVLLAAPLLCTGSEHEVALEVAGFNDDDAQWLREELGAWLRHRDHLLCQGAGGLTVAKGAEGISLRFISGLATRERLLLPVEGDAGLLRYQVAAASEELIRSTWEGPRPPRWQLHAAASSHHLSSGVHAVGGSVGGTLFVSEGLGVELVVGAASWLASPLPAGASLGGGALTVDLGLVWAPLRAGAFSAGVRGGVCGGVLFLTVPTSYPAAARGTAPWLAVSAGPLVAFSWRKFVVALVGELGYAFAGAVVQAEGANAREVQGLEGRLAVRVGIQW